MKLNLRGESKRQMSLGGLEFTKDLYLREIATETTTAKQQHMNKADKRLGLEKTKQQQPKPSFSSLLARFSCSDWSIL